ncbi:MAG: FAD binding domain-containing protein [Streptomycetales bacterium]
MAGTVPPRVAVVGGSLGGLTAALVLRKIGCDVEVFERGSERLHGRGVGIVLQPDTVRWFERSGSVDAGPVSTGSSRLRYLRRDGGVEYEGPSRWRFASWNAIYRPLLADFGTSRYHLGEGFVGFDRHPEGVALRFASGRQERADLAVFADGISSTARRRILPEVIPHYAGYVGWRGTVTEAELSAETAALFEDALIYAVVPSGHIVGYFIPGPDGELTQRRRDFNYVWYRNVPPGPALDELLTDRKGTPCAVSVHPGMVQQRFLGELREAARDRLPPALEEAVTRTPEPFIQPIFDVEVPKMAFGRVCLIGDAAFAARPHPAAGTAKAAADGWALAEALRAADFDVPAALAKWERAQLALGRSVVARGQEMGRRSQFDSSWQPGDPSLAFGLYGPGR